MFDDQQDLYEIREPLRHPALREAAAEETEFIPPPDETELRLTRLDLARAIA